MNKLNPKIVKIIINNTMMVIILASIKLDKIDEFWIGEFWIGEEDSKSWFFSIDNRI